MENIKEDIKKRVSKAKKVIALNYLYEKIDELLSFSHTEKKQEKLDELRKFVKIIENEEEWEIKLNL